MQTKKGGTRAVKKSGRSNKSRNFLSGFASRIWTGSLWRKVLISLIAVVLLVLVSSYGVAQWYIHKHKNEPLIIGTTFITDYAEGFGLNPQETLEAILKDLDIKQIRLVSYWKHIEPVQGTYDFSGLDWQFEMANKYDAKVSLAIGMRQPRWPECHEPQWAKPMPKEQWQPLLYDYMTAVVDRYKDNPALGSYQLENEFFMKVFGECKDFDRSRFVEEYQLVKNLDPVHPIIISRSNNWVGLPMREPEPDVYAVSVYKRVWDATLTKRYYEYPQPAWTYATLAGSKELISGKNMIVHELQAEPWPPRSQLIVNTPLEEQYKSMNAERMRDRVEFGKATGMRSLDLWGAEWWYWLKVNKGDPNVWNVAKEEVQKVKIENQNLGY